MLYLLPNQNNTIVVTWSQRATDANAAYYLLITRHIETQVEQTIIVPKASNLSQYTQRYDRFTIATQFTREGQYEYTCYEATGTNVSTCIAVVDSGLILVKTTEQSYLNPGGEKQYAVFAPAVTPSNPAPTPIIITTEGIYSGFVSVQVSGTVSGNIYYTTDGTTPSSQNGTLYDDNNRPVLTATALFQARLYADGFTLGNVASAYYTIIPLSVSITPAAGIYPVDAPPFIEFVTNTELGQIYYTLDGSTPTIASGTLYTGGFTLSEPATVKARVFESPAAPSDVATSVFQLKLTTPFVDPVSGTFTSNVFVNFSQLFGLGNIFVSFNGAPEIDLTDEGITLDINTSWTAQTRLINYVSSDVVSGSVTIQCAAPTISPAGGTFDASQEVTLITNEAGGSTYYTTNGSEPTIASGTLYTAPFTITADTTVKAKTFRTNTEPSTTVQAVFVEIQPMILLGDADSSGGSRLYRSFNAGSSWTELQPFGNVDRQYADSAISTDSQSIFLIASSGGTNFLTVSKDSGTTWQTPTLPGTLFSASNCQGSEDGTKIVMIANIGLGLRVLVSEDGGLSFEERSPINASFSVAAITPNGSTIYAMRGSGASALDVIYRSTDMGLNWSVVVNAATFTPFSAVCSNNYLYYHDSNGFTDHRVPHDSTVVTQITTSINNALLAVSHNDEVLLAVQFGGGNQIRRSTNLGASFSVITIPFASAQRDVAVSANGTRAVIGAISSNACYSSDSGANFSNFPTTPGSGARIWQVANLN